MHPSSNGDRSDPSSHRAPVVCELRLRFSGRDDTAALLKEVSLLGMRVAKVLELGFDSGVPGAATLTGRVLLVNTRPESLQRWLERAVDVVDVRVAELCSTPRTPAP